MVQDVEENENELICYTAVEQQTNCLVDKRLVPSTDGSKTGLDIHGGEASVGTNHGN